MVQPEGGVAERTPELPEHTMTFPPDVGTAGMGFNVKVIAFRVALLQPVVVFLDSA